MHHRQVDRPRAGVGEERVEGAPGGLAAHGGDVHAVPTRPPTLRPRDRRGTAAAGAATIQGNTCAAITPRTQAAESA